jgi:hypothetical protein
VELGQATQKLALVLLGRHSEARNSESRPAHAAAVHGVHTFPVSLVSISTTTRSLKKP